MPQPICRLISFSFSWPTMNQFCCSTINSSHPFKSHVINPLDEITHFIHYFGSFAILSEVLSVLMCYSIHHLMPAGEYCSLNIHHPPCCQWKKEKKEEKKITACSISGTVSCMCVYVIFFYTMKVFHPCCSGHFHSGVLWQMWVQYHKDSVVVKEKISNS